MSMLSSQADELREIADKMDRLEAWERVSVPWMQGKLAAMLREAADTIEELSAKLQGVMDTRYNEMFGTPERAARTLAKACDECDDDFPCYECPLNPIVGSNVYEPELLEWLRGDV